MVPIEDLKAWIGLASTDEYDELLERLDAQAVSYLEGRSGRKIGGVASIVEYHSGGNGGRVAMIAQSPIATLQSVESRTSLAGDWETADVADFEVIDRRVLSRLGTLSIGTSNYRITYRAGYKAGTEPGWLVRAVTGLVELWFRNRVQATGGISPSLEQEALPIPEPVETAIRNLRGIPGLA